MYQKDKKHFAKQKNTIHNRVVNGISMNNYKTIIKFISNSNLVTQYSGYTDRGTVKCIGDLDSCLLRTCMYDLSVSNINSHMADAASASIEKEISRFCLRCTDPCTTICLCFRGMWQIYTVFCKNRKCKSGTINSVCQACSTPDIRISNKLCCIGRSDLL